MTRQLVRIEHCQTVHPEDIPRFAGRVASVQPVHVRDDGRVAINRLGAQRMDEFFAIRALSESGAILAFGSDWPIAPPDPIEAIGQRWMAATMTAALYSLTARSMHRLPLAAYTTGARLALGMAPATLEPGGAADLVVLDRDPVAADWAHEPPKVLATISSGRLTYDAGTLETTS